MTLRQSWTLLLVATAVAVPISARATGATVSDVPSEADDAHCRERSRGGDCLLPYRHKQGAKKYVEWAYKDPVNLFTQPAFWGAEEWRKFALGAGSTVVLLPLDQSVRDAVQEHKRSSRTDFLNDIRDIYWNKLGGYAAALFVAGLVGEKEKLADTGFLALESVFYAQTVSGTIKSLTHRERPRSAQDQYEFHGPGGSTTDGSSAFVSGDTIGAFAFAASVSQIWKKKWLTRTLYLLSSLVALQRMDSDAHWLSDVVGAALIGRALGRRIARFHYPEKCKRGPTPQIEMGNGSVSVVLRF